MKLCEEQRVGWECAGMRGGGQAGWSWRGGQGAEAEPSLDLTKEAGEGRAET